VFEFANSSLQDGNIRLISSAILGVDYSLGLASDGGFPRCDADVAGVSLSRIPFLFTNSYSYLPLCYSTINA
jgi:hypothetical protein